MLSQVVLWLPLVTEAVIESIYGTDNRSKQAEKKEMEPYLAVMEKRPNILIASCYGEQNILFIFRGIINSLFSPASCGPVSNINHPLVSYTTIYFTFLASNYFLCLNDLLVKMISRIDICYSNNEIMLSSCLSEK
jgi:hypothetical protein